jgi:hypothetical protein
MRTQHPKKLTSLAGGSGGVLAKSRTEEHLERHFFSISRSQVGLIYFI